MEQSISRIFRTNILHKGKISNVYETNNPDILEFEESDCTYTGTIISGKSIFNTSISKEIFKQLEDQGIPTHYLGNGSNLSSILIKRATPIPLEVISELSFFRDYADSVSVDHITKLDNVSTKFMHKVRSEHISISRSEIISKNILTLNEIEYIEYTNEKIAYILENFFANYNCNLISFKSRFGKMPNGQIILIGNLSSDSCLLVNKKSSCIIKNIWKDFA